ncbi:MAG: hypothetical protein H0T42_10365 [Deltaproteobacteria bacterium]|nr:hypothetical protein [Deltaproteobacteria bacterium]
MQDSGWKRAVRGAKLGAICGLGPTLILFGWYYARNHHLPLPWAQMGLISALLGPLTGAALGGFVQLLIAGSDRVSGPARLVINPITAGLVGGAVTSIVAGVFAIAVFGSYRGPYVGTIESSAMLIAASFSLATLLTMDALRGSQTGGPVSDLIPAAGRVLFAALATAAVTAGTAILLAPSLVSAGIFWTARHLLQTHSVVAVGCVLGISVGAIFGMHLGLSIWLGRRAQRAAG